MSMDLVPQSQLDNQEWKEWKAYIDSDRDNDDILSHEDVALQEEDLTAEERMFLRDFPLLEWELKEGIRSLYDVANSFDKTHQTFTKTNMVTSSIGVISAVLDIMALALAPATAGGSLVLSTASQGLGFLMEATSIFTRMLEYSRDKRAHTQVSGLVHTHDQEAEDARGKRAAMAASKAALHCGDTVNSMRKNIRAFRAARAHPHLATAAKRFLISGRVSARRMKQMEKFFDGTLLVMTKNLRLLRSLSSGFSLVQDLATVLNNWRQLKEGARSEHAEELRAQAGQMERLLTGFTQYYESLQQKLLQERMTYESLEGAMENLSLSTARLQGSRR